MKIEPLLTFSTFGLKGCLLPLGAVSSARMSAAVSRMDSSSSAKACSRRPMAASCVTRAASSGAEPEGKSYISK